MRNLPVKIVMGLVNLVARLLRKTVKIAILTALATGLVFILDTLLLDERPERKV